MNLESSNYLSLYNLWAATWNSGIVGHEFSGVLVVISWYIRSAYTISLTLDCTHVERVFRFMSWWRNLINNCVWPWTVTVTLFLRCSYVGVSICHPIIVIVIVYCNVKRVINDINWLWRCRLRFSWIICGISLFVRICYRRLI
jgi:hypothetical protein